MSKDYSKIKNQKLKIAIVQYFIFIFLLLLLSVPAYAVDRPLDVPYTTQIPIGYWTNPWSNACEESSITMVNQFYLGIKGKISPATAKKLISPLFTYEDKIFGENHDTNSYRTLRVIEDQTIFTGEIKQQPTLQEIKDHLKLGFPVISLHYGFDLPNKNLHFRSAGSSYHMMVISGFDNETETFITNDPGDTITGYNHKYNYDDFLATLGDFDHTTKKVNKNKPRVILTYPKLVKSEADDKVYYLKNNKKYYISDPKIFAKNNWSWDWIKKVPNEWLGSLENESDLTIDNYLPASPKLVIASGKKSIYLIENNTRYRISSPNTFKEHGWNWRDIEEVDYSWLQKIPKGEVL